MSLSAQLKVETIENHQQSEAHPWVKLLVKNKLPLECYYQYLSQLKPVYQALESNFESVGLLNLYRPKLTRHKKLDLDLIYFERNFLCRYTPVSSIYSSHITGISSNEPHRLIGHFYVRYFGDMLGGKIIKKIVRHNFSLPNQALNFYDFEDFNLTFPEGIDLIRRAMNKVVLTKNQRDEVIFEAKQAYYFTYGIMTESLIPVG